MWPNLSNLNLEIGKFKFPKKFLVLSRLKQNINLSGAKNE
jgi:hypothetical protein